MPRDSTSWDMPTQGARRGKWTPSQLRCATRSTTNMTFLWRTLLKFGGGAALWPVGCATGQRFPCSSSRPSKSFPEELSDSGEGRWTILAAIESTAPAPVLTAALFERFVSRGEDGFAAKLLSARRNEFGGHLEKAAAAK